MLGRARRRPYPPTVPARTHPTCPETEEPAVDEQRQAAVDRYFAAIAALDEDAFVATFAPDGVSYDPVGAPPSAGEEGLRRFFSGITRTFRRMELTPDDTFHAGGHVAVRWTGRGESHDGVAVEYHGIDVFDVDDAGRIARLWAYWDPKELFAQLKAGG
jgi:steroid Delta-isomerase